MNRDFVVIGGGIAGLSAASRLARHGRVAVIEAEDALGYHSSGRSVSFSHYGIGNSAVRGLTAWSRPFFEAQPDGFCETAISRLFPSLYFATGEMMPALSALEAEMARFTDAIEWLDEGQIAELCPVIRTGGDGAVKAVLDHSGLKLDADALLQSYARAVRSGGSEVLTGRRIASIRRRDGQWEVATEQGETWAAPILVNAAGSWAEASETMYSPRSRSCCDAAARVAALMTPLLALPSAVRDS